MLGFLFVISALSAIHITPIFASRLHPNNIDPDAFKNISELVKSKGYPFEEHLVETADHYILGLHRIPSGRHGNELSNTSRPVVLLQHGFISCSAVWVENLVNQSLGFILADMGMDVWMGNSRGNTYSRRHKTLNSTDQKFWAYSWDEMAKYDLPATVDYIVKTTNVSQIYFVGYSESTATGFAELGRNKTLASKIKHFFALAPLANMGNVTGPLKAMSPLAEDFAAFYSLFGNGELLPSSEFMRSFGRDFCGNDVGGIICENFLFFVAGYDSKELNQTRLPVYAAENPAGTSVQNLLHYTQAVLTGKFQMFDYDSAKLNMDHYNQTTPPMYDVSQMKNNVSLYTGGKDIIADATDVTFLLKTLPNVYRHVDIPYWEHLDFIWAIDAAVKCYNDIIATIKKYENQ